MRKEKSKTTEYPVQPDSGTYQTGAHRPRNEHRGVIAVLMILVTFLGGIASALGILNIRLLQRLSQENTPQENVAVYVDATHTGTPENPNDALPSIPARNEVDIPLETPGEALPPESICADEILEENRSSIVSVTCEGTDGQPIWGVVLDERGYILTNAYPVFQEDAIYVALSDGSSYRAALVGMDEFTDLAVLYIAANNLTAAQFASPEALQTGDFLACLADTLALTEGEVCAGEDHAVGEEILRLMRTDLQNVSGPVFNGCGQIVGFASPFFPQEDGTCAIASTTALEVAEQIIARGSIFGRPCLGVELEEVQTLHQHYWQLPEGLRVSSIPADNTRLSGLQQGDILIALNGEKITDRASLCAVLWSLREGEAVTAIVVRDNREVTLELVIQVSGTGSE